MESSRGESRDGGGAKCKSSESHFVFDKEFDNTFQVKNDVKKGGRNSGYSFPFLSMIDDVSNRWIFLDGCGLTLVPEAFYFEQRFEVISMLICRKRYHDMRQFDVICEISCSMQFLEAIGWKIFVFVERQLTLFTGWCVGAQRNIEISCRLKSTDYSLRRQSSSTKKIFIQNEIYENL